MGGCIMGRMACGLMGGAMYNGGGAPWAVVMATLKKKRTKKSNAEEG
jgi:hypothetical protein